MVQLYHNRNVNKNSLLFKVDYTRLCEPVICLMLTGQENIFNLLSPGG